MAALADILPWVDEIPDIEVSGVTDDSREVSPGDLFVCVAGERSDGHDFADAAVAGGALAIAAEHPLHGLSVPVIVVPQLARQRSAIAGAMLEDPSSRLYCVGVTGTNGKTSVAYYLAELASRLGHPTGYLGTIGWGMPDLLAPALLTTDSAINTQKRLAGLLEFGARWVAMEVSSHALDQYRVEAVDFDVAVFTNLSRDHLDYHDSFESYGAAKARLFEDVSVAVINVDDAFGAELATSVSAGTVLTYGRGGDIRACGLEFHDQGVSGCWQTPWGSAEFNLPLFGEFAVANLSAVLGVLCHAGLALEQVVAAAAQVAPVPGRVEFFPGRPGAVVDYAHTPDALEKVLQTLRPHVEGKLICVVGCGGDRDTGKRPLMAAVAESGSDLLWLTSDNPRSERPEAIIDDMRTGLTGVTPVRECVDRRQAIIQAFADADPDDLLLIAGKGHEDYQEIAGQRLPFSDRQIVAELISAQPGIAAGSSSGEV